MLQLSLCPSAYPQFSLLSLPPNPGRCRHCHFPPRKISFPRMSFLHQPRVDSQARLSAPLSHSIKCTQNDSLCSCLQELHWGICAVGIWGSSDVRQRTAIVTAVEWEWYSELRGFCWFSVQRSRGTDPGWLGSKSGWVEYIYLLISREVGMGGF